jgi:hypothetical protein
MTLPTNDDFSNRGLSIEELEAIAAGWPKWLHSAVHAVENELSVIAIKAINGFENSTTGSQIKGGAIIGAIIGVWSLLAK